MSKGGYKTKSIFYPNRWQPTEDLIADGYYYASNKRSEAIEIAAHIMAAACANDDNELFNVGCDLMRVSNSPCIFQPDYTAENATDNNNRPSAPITPVVPNDFGDCQEEDDEKWDDSFDFIFDNRIIVKKVKSTLDKLTFKKNSHVTWFVVYIVFLHLKWLTEGCEPRPFLQWVNLHYNCGWKKDYNFIFSRNVDAALRNNDISLWKNMSANNNITYNQGPKYYNFAVLLRNTFEIVTINGKEQKEPVQDFIVGKNRDRYEFVLNPKNLINTGK